MKKCLIMFGLLLLTLVVAVLTERKQEIATLENFAVAEKIGEDIAFDQNLPNENASSNNEQPNVN